MKRSRITARSGKLPSIAQLADVIVFGAEMNATQEIINMLFGYGSGGHSDSRWRKSRCQSYSRSPLYA